MKGGGGAPTRFPPSPAGASGKHNRLDSGHQPYSPGSLFGVLWRQSGAPGQNPCRLQGSPRDPLGVQQCPPEVPPPGRPLVWAGGPVLAPCHRASWNLTPSPQSHTQAPWPMTSVMTAGLGVAQSPQNLAQDKLDHPSFTASEKHW